MVAIMAIVGGSATILLVHFGFYLAGYKSVLGENSWRYWLGFISGSSAMFVIENVIQYGAAP